MPANTWQPPQTGDRQLDRSFLDLADRLAGIDAVLASVAVPGVEITTRNLTIVDQSYVEVRGSGGVTITLPKASFRGTGRGALLTIQNFSLTAATVRTQPGDVLNNGAAFTIEANTGALFSGNGVARWTGIKPAGDGAALTIQDHDVDASPTRERLNFIGDLVVADNPGNLSTDVGITLPSFTDSLDPWSAFKPHGIYIPSGVVRDGAGGDEASWADSQGGAPTTQFDTYQFAYPEVAPFDGTIDSLAFYLSGGGGPKFWVGIARNTTDANGNPYPGALVAIFAYTHATGFDGNKLRTGSVSVSVTKGELFWVCCQGDATQPCIGNRPSTCYRNVFGNNTPATWSATNTRGLIGWVTTSAVTYNAAMSAFPTSSTEMLAYGSKPYISGGGNTVLRPSVYHRFT